MVIIIGLGNPGQKYTYTRHNIGFQVVDEFARKNKFPEFRLSKRFKSLVSKDKEITLVKPQTFMNQSGKAVSTLINFYKTKEIIVIHDDIDLPLGKIRISKNRGSAGHKGVESIIRDLGTKDFVRFRIGIQPRLQRGKPKNVERFVLQKFDKEEEKVIKKTIQQATSKLKNLDF